MLIEVAQVKAQQNKVTYDSPIDTLSVVKSICDLKQICTQSGGLRPFGVSVLVAGIDVDGPVLYETDPTGIYFRYKATAIGEGENEVDEFLHKNYKDNITIEEALKLCLKILSKLLEKEFTVDRIDAAYITTKDKRFTKVKREKLEKLMKEARKK